MQSALDGNFPLPRNIVNQTGDDFFPAIRSVRGFFALIEYIPVGAQESRP
jgi:hypothetical protein